MVFNNSLGIIKNIIVLDIPINNDIIIAILIIYFTFLIFLFAYSLDIIGNRA